MRRPRLDLNLLVALRLLLTERNVTRAAELMHRSQPAMSATLGRLREYFGDALIAPVGRRMELTPLGQCLLEPVSDVLVRIDATLQTLPAFDAGTSRRRFTVVASDYVFNVLLRDVLQALRISAPEVCLQVVAADDRCAALLEAGEVDLLLVPERFASAQHASTALFEDDHRLIADSANAAIGDSIDLADFMACRHVTYDQQGRSFFDVWFARNFDDARRVDVIVYSFMQVAQVVAGTPRVAVVLTRLAQQLAESMSLRMARLAFGSPSMVVVMQWHRHRELDPGLQWLRDVMLAQTAHLLAPPTAPPVLPAPLPAPRRRRK